MSFIDSYETQLVEAGRRRRDSRLGHRIMQFLRGRRGGAAVVILALLVGVPATATTVGWNPFDDPGRDARFAAPTLSADAPASELTAILGVLRREQNGADRSLASSEGVRHLSEDQVSGVKLDYVRLVDADRGIALVPVERFGPAVRRPPGAPSIDLSPYRDAVCFYEADTDPATGGLSCANAAKIQAGIALAASGDHVTGIVPDGVARVRLSRGGRSAEADVRSNLFRAGPEAPQQPELIEWLAADGSVIKRIEPNRRPPPAP